MYSRKSLIFYCSFIGNLSFLPFQNIDHNIYVKNIVTPQATLVPLNVRHYFILDEKVDLVVPENASLLQLSMNFPTGVKIEGNVFIRKYLGSSVQQIASEKINRLENAHILMVDLIFKERILANSVSANFDVTNLFKQTSDSALFTQKINSKKNLHRFLLKNNLLKLGSNEIALKTNHFNAYTSDSNNLHHAVIMEADTQENSVDTTISSHDLIFEAQLHAESITFGTSNFTDKSIHSSINFETTLHNILNTRHQLIQELIVSGEVRYRSHRMKIKEINELQIFDSFHSFVSKARSKNFKKSFEIKGVKLFVSNLNTLGAFFNEVNQNIQMRNWTENVLRQQLFGTLNHQTMYSSGSNLSRILSENVQIDQRLNGFAFIGSHNIIFVNSNSFNKIEIICDISFSKNTILNAGSTLISYESRPCNASFLGSEDTHLPTKKLFEVNILGSAKFFLPGESSEQNSIFIFLENSIQPKLGKEINTNQIVLNANNKFSFNRISSSLNKPEIPINTIQIFTIINDAVSILKNKLGSVLEPTIFNNMTNFVGITNICITLESIASDLFQVQKMNFVDMILLNHIAFNRSSIDLSIFPWQKILFLRPPSAKSAYLNNDQTINGIYFANVFHTYTENQNRSFTSSFVRQKGSDFQTVAVSNGAGVNLVNELSLDYFLDNRLKLKIQDQFSKHQMNNGFLNLENFIMYGDAAKIDQVNDAVCDDAVLRYFEENQEIIGNKRILSAFANLWISKPIHTWKINHLDFVSLYAKTTFLNRKQLINEIIIRRPYQLKCQEETNCSIVHFFKKMVLNE